MRIMGFYVGFILIFSQSLFAVSELDRANRTLSIEGHDVRRHQDRYILTLGPENTLLQERTYRLLKKSGSQLIVISQGEVIQDSSPSRHFEEFYKSPSVQIRLGRPFKKRNKVRQIIVFKFKGQHPLANKTIAFETLL